MKRNVFLLILLPLSLMLNAQSTQNKPKVYLECHVQEFANTDNSFAIKLSNQLREQGWVIVKVPSKADYRLIVDANTREYSETIRREETRYDVRKYRDTVMVVGDNYTRTKDNNVEKQTGTTTVAKDNYVVESSTHPTEYMYFVYMDAHVQLLNKKLEVLYEDVLEIKDGHSLGFDQAARSAASKTLKKIAEILPTKIAQ